MASYAYLLLGLVLVVAGVWLMIDFIAEFLRLILGVVLLVLGLQFLSASRRPKIRIR